MSTAAPERRRRRRDGWPITAARWLQWHGAMLGIDDHRFDALLPAPLRAHAGVHFTPAAIAVRALELLSPSPGQRVLDVGAGVGKFCILAARRARSTCFVGVERRHALVNLATAIAGHLRVPNVEFVHGDMRSVDWSGFEGFYLYNPFGEQLFDDRWCDDGPFDPPADGYRVYVEHVRERLRHARAGTRVVTYHGFGGRMPRGFSLSARERTGATYLELWTKG